jgi:hypothetical protein
MHCHMVHRQYLILCLQCLKLLALKFWKIMLHFHLCNSKIFFSLCGTVRAYNILAYRVFALFGFWNLIAKGIQKTKELSLLQSCYHMSYWFNKKCWTFPVLKWCKVGEFQVHNCFAACICSVCVTQSSWPDAKSFPLHILSFALIVLLAQTTHFVNTIYAVKVAVFQ